MLTTPNCQPAKKKPSSIKQSLLLRFVCKSTHFQPLKSNLICTDAGAKKGLKDHDHAVGKEQQI